MTDIEAQPTIPEAAGIARPQTDAQKEAFAVYLLWLADMSSWGRRGWERSDIAKNWCEEREQ